jgi:Leucine-rich repeat (LRR) protein
LSKFDISNCNLRAEGGRALAAGLKGNQVITELNISDNYLGTKSWDHSADTSGIIAIADAIPNMGALSKLDASDNKMFGWNDKTGVTAWAAALKASTSITELSLAKNDMSPDNAKILAGSIRDNGALTVLDVSQNNIGELVAELGDTWECRFRQCVSGFDKDGDGILSENEIGEFIIALGITCISDVEKGIKYFCYDADESSQEYLEGGNMTVEGLVSFYKTASERRPKDVVNNMKTLNLVTVKPIGVIALANAISDMGAISSVNLLKNDIGVAQAEDLVSILKGHLTLKSLCGNKGNETALDMSGKMNGAADAIMLVTEIIDSRALLQLDVSDNFLSTEKKRAIVKLCDSKGIRLTLAAVMPSAFGGDSSDY